MKVDTQMKFNMATSKIILPSLRVFTVPFILVSFSPPPPPARRKCNSPDNSPPVRFSQVSDIAACCTEPRQVSRKKNKNMDPRSVLEQKIDWWYFQSIGGPVRQSNATWRSVAVNISRRDRKIPNFACKYQRPIYWIEGIIFLAVARYPRLIGIHCLLMGLLITKCAARALTS